MLGSYLPGWSDEIRLEGSYSWHDQDSWYGDSPYAASQHIVFGNALWGPMVGRHDLLVGASVRYQTYDDNTTATIEVDRRLIPGVFTQDEVRFDNGMTVLGGLRADHHQEHGVIASPRVAFKWDALEHTSFRINAGTGFRVVNLFTEDHAALTGARDVVITSQLEPERSRSITLNVNQVVEFGPNPMMIDLDLFHTRFSNKIVPDYDVDPNQIVYGNLEGHAVSRGVGLTLNQNVDFDRFLYSVGVTVQDVYTVEADQPADEFFAPNLRGVLSATYNARSLPLRFDYTGSITGPMRLPAYDAPFTRADVFDPQRAGLVADRRRRGALPLGEEPVRLCAAECVGRSCEPVRGRLRHGVRVWAAARPAFDARPALRGWAVEEMWRTGLPSLVAGLLIATAVPLGAQGKVDDSHRLEVYGEADCDWTIRRLDGGELELESFRGRVLFINLWASWCTPCIREMETIERLKHRLADTDTEFLIVAAEGERPVRRHLRRYPYDLPIYLEIDRMPSSFGLRGLPTSWVVDRAGRIVLVRHGEAIWDTDEVEQFVRSLAEPG